MHVPDLSQLPWTPPVRALRPAVCACPALPFVCSAVGLAVRHHRRHPRAVRKKGCVEAGRRWKGEIRCGWLESVSQMWVCRTGSVRPVPAAQGWLPIGLFAAARRCQDLSGDHEWESVFRVPPVQGSFCPEAFVADVAPLPGDRRWSVPEASGRAAFALQRPARRPASSCDVAERPSSSEPNSQCSCRLEVRWAGTKR